MDYEQARKIALKEAKNHSKYTVNRLDHLTRQVKARYGDGAAKELMKETLAKRKEYHGTKAAH